MSHALFGAAKALRLVIFSDDVRVEGAKGWPALNLVG